MQSAHWWQWGCVTIDRFWINDMIYCTLWHSVWLHFTGHYYTHTSIRPIWGPRPDFNYCQTVGGFLLSGSLSDKSTCLSFTNAADSHQQSFSGPSPAGLTHIRDSPSLDGQVPFIYPRNRVAQLYPQTLGSLFIYNSQGYSGGIRTHLHAGDT
jgi:hypothetical protein